MPTVASATVLSELLSTRVLALGESEPGVGLPSSEHEGGLSDVDRDKRLCCRDAAVFDRIHWEILSASGFKRTTRLCWPHPKWKDMWISIFIKGTGIHEAFILERDGGETLRSMFECTIIRNRKLQVRATGTYLVHPESGSPIITKRKKFHVVPIYTIRNNAWKTICFSEIFTAPRIFLGMAIQPYTTI